MPEQPDNQKWFTSRSGPKLEPEFQADFDAWKAAKNPQTTSKLLKAISPVIDRAISAHVGASDPILRSHARRMALKGLETYDPSKAKIGTHLTNYLQSLRRYSRERNQGVHVPERQFYAQQTLQDRAKELEARLGRSPSYDELAQFTKVPLAKVREMMTRGLPVNEGVFSGPEGESFLPPTIQDPSRAFAELVYADLNPIDQQILDWSIGLYGKKLSNKEIARKLNRTPGAISQRKVLIQKLLDEAHEEMR